MQVLMAIDGSPTSLGAVQQAGRILSPQRDEVAFYYSPPGAEAIRSPAGDVIYRGRKALAEGVFCEAMARLPVGWPPVTRKIVGVTDPHEGILRSAEEGEFDLIVVGATGFNRLERLLLSSVSRTVVHAAHVPVLVVREGSKAAESSDFRLLVAFENAERGKQLAAALQHFTWPAGTSALALHVVQNIFGGEIPDWLDVQARSRDAEAMVKLWVEDHDAQLAAAARQVQEVCGTLPAPLQDAECSVREGLAQQQIVQVASEQRSDLIVMGAKGSTPLARLLIGSTAESVLNHAPCSVLLIRHAGE